VETLPTITPPAHGANSDVVDLSATLRDSFGVIGKDAIGARGLDVRDLGGRVGGVGKDLPTAAVCVFHEFPRGVADGWMNRPSAYMARADV
jgi:hypothetical protein